MMFFSTFVLGTVAWIIQMIYRGGSKLSFSLWIYKINLGNLLVTVYVM